MDFLSESMKALDKNVEKHTVERDAILENLDSLVLTLEHKRALHIDAVEKSQTLQNHILDIEKLVNAMDCTITLFPSLIFMCLSVVSGIP